MNTKVIPHPHAALIAEWIKDTSRMVEYRTHSAVPWKYAPIPTWFKDYEYRFKPQPKPDVVKYHNAYPEAGWNTMEEAKKGASTTTKGIYKNTYNGETGLLKSVEKLD